MNEKRQQKISSLVKLTAISGLIIFACVLPLQRNLTIHFIDVGNGDAIFIKLPDQTNLLIDTGEKEYAEKIVKYLRSLGVKEVQKVVLTHPHSNHFGGLAGIIHEISVGQVYVNGDDNGGDVGYKALMQQLALNRIPVTTLRRGDIIPFSSPALIMRVLHPPEFDNSLDSTNSKSIALLFTYDQTDFFFTGDVDEPRQDQIINLYPELSSVDCVQLPHHGKDVSDLFAQFFQDKIFVASSDNNHQVRKSAEKLKGRVLRTDRLGTVVIASNGKKIIL